MSIKFIFVFVLVLTCAACGTRNPTLSDITPLKTRFNSWDDAECVSRWEVLRTVDPELLAKGVLESGNVVFLSMETSRPNLIGLSDDEEKRCITKYSYITLQPSGCVTDNVKLKDAVREFCKRYNLIILAELKANSGQL